MYSMHDFKLAPVKGSYIFTANIRTSNNNLYSSGDVSTIMAAESFLDFA